jgi:uncharacterized protein (TIGR00730 family)
MEAGNRGALDAGGVSSASTSCCRTSRSRTLRHAELSFNFHYFAIRKMHFLMRAKAIAIFPGGFGTLDETFEALTLVQTGRMAPLPILLFGGDFWRRVIDWDALVEAGTIAPGDVDLVTHVETAAEAVAALDAWRPPTL